MSQAKVDQYKREKANRKKIMARDKAKHLAGTICGWVILAAIAGWAGYSIYHYYESNKPIETVYCDTSDLDDYLEGIGIGQ